MSTDSSHQIEINPEELGFPTSYSSHTVGISHQFNNLAMIRPEIGF
jgi:hypothetical protein